MEHDLVRVPPLVSVAGKKKSGKTTMVVALAAELSGRGWKVATIKHSHGFNVDHEGRDSWRHRHEGGSIRTAIVTDRDFALMGEWVEEQPLTPLEMAERWFSDADIVLVEGFRLERLPTIEVFRKRAHDRPWYDPGRPGHEVYLAIATDDEQMTARVPVYAIDHPATVAALADIIERQVMKQWLPA